MLKDTNVLILKKIKVLHKKLTQLLKIEEKLLALADWIKEKDVSRNLFKSTTKNILFFNREQLFVVRKIIKIFDITYCWISKEGEDKIISKRFLRQELYAINDQLS